MRLPSRPASFFVWTATQTSLPDVGCFNKRVTAFAGPGLDEPLRLQFPDDFGPSHIARVNLSIGYVDTRRRHDAFHERRFDSGVPSREPSLASR